MAGKKGQAPRTEFSQKLFDEICERLASGGDENSLRQICNEDHMPDRTTFIKWSKRTPELLAQYDRAYLARQDTYFDEIIDIADTEVDPAKGKVRIDARKWAWARMNRKKFGDSMALTGDPDAPLHLVLNGSDVHG